MGHTLGGALIVASPAGMAMAYLYLKHVERQRRSDIVHLERLTAMDKGIPLPELPLDPPQVPNPLAPLMHGIVWSALGGGAMLTLFPIGPQPNVPLLWPLPLPLVLLGIGLILYYALASDRAR